MFPPAFLSYLCLLLAQAIRAFAYWGGSHRCRCSRRVPQAIEVEEAAEAILRCQPKPAWVRTEVLRLAALSGAGCHTIEKLFSRIYASSRNMTVSKSYVHYTVRKHRYEIAVLRHKLKRRPPRPVPVNQVWAMDMTGKGDVFGLVHEILASWITGAAGC